MRSRVHRLSRKPDSKGTSPYLREALAQDIYPYLPLSIAYQYLDELIRHGETAPATQAPSETRATKKISQTQTITGTKGRRSPITSDRGPGVPNRSLDRGEKEAPVTHRGFVRKRKQPADSIRQFFPGIPEPPCASHQLGNSGLSSSFNYPGFEHSRASSPITCGDFLDAWVDTGRYPSPPKPFSTDDWDTDVKRFVYNDPSPKESEAGVLPTTTTSEPDSPVGDTSDVYPTDLGSIDDALINLGIPGDDWFEVWYASYPLQDHTYPAKEGSTGMATV